jgi:hypothetical protein
VRVYDSNKAISQHKNRKVTRYVKLYALGLCFPFAKPLYVTSIQSDALCGSSYANTKFKPGHTCSKIVRNFDLLYGELMNEMTSFGLKYFSRIIFAVIFICLLILLIFYNNINQLSTKDF